MVFQVHLDHEVQRFVGDEQGNVQKIVTNHGSYDCDLAVVAIGVVPNTKWLAGSDIAQDTKGGILVDESLKTNADDVFAAGDCAVVRWFDGSRRPEQLWYTAREQGRVAGKGLLGDNVNYDRGAWYNSAKLMDIEYTSAGLVNMNLPDEQNWFFYEKDKVTSTSRIVLQGDKVVGFNMLGRRWDHSVFNRWIAERRGLEYVLAHLQDAAFDSEFVPPLTIPSGYQGFSNFTVRK